MLVVEHPVSPSERCRFGGTELLRGLDDGMPGGAAGDGELAPEEVDTNTLYCAATPPPGSVAASGLDTRPPTNTCRPPSGSSLTEGVAVVEAFPGLRFPPNAACSPFNDTSCDDAFRPVALVQHPTDRAFYVAEQTGRVLRFPDAPAPGTAAEVVLDIEDRVVFGYEPGLLNLAVNPRDPDALFLTYVTCNAPNAGVCADGEGSDVSVVVSRFLRDARGALDRASERVVLSVPKPRTEHNGGGAAFAPDGTLFVALGDGGDFPSSSAQDGTSLLGKILRLDVHDADGSRLDDADPAYRIPADNPFATSVTVRPEVFAIGFRNPWRFGFAESLGGDGLPRLYVGDVGLVTAEELDFVEPGSNHGWPILEGTFCRPTGDEAFRVTVTTDTSCFDRTRFTAPLHSYVQAKGVSITGGPVYRGARLPALRGGVMISDFSRGSVVLVRSSPDGVSVRHVVETDMMVSSFAEDLAHEVYVFDWWSGRIARLEPIDASGSRPASRLSETGCVDPLDPTRPAASGIPFSPSMPFFSEEGVEKSRFLYLADGTTLTEYANSGTLILQPGSALVKSFDVAGRRVETRIVFRHADGGFSFWTYRFRPDGSDADLVETGATVPTAKGTWTIPSRGECLDCHTRPTGRVLGLRVEQLNALGFYASTGRWANQLETLRALSLVDRVEAVDPSRPISDANARIVPLPPASTLPAAPRIEDESRSLRDRVGQYLETNCSHCHRPAGGARGTFDLRASQFLAPDSTVCRAVPQSEAYDDPTARIVVPGAPDQSLLVRRMEETTLPYRMHPYRADVDTVGAALIRRWVATDATVDCPSP